MENLVFIESTVKKHQWTTGRVPRISAIVNRIAIRWFVLTCFFCWGPVSFAGSQLIQSGDSAPDGLILVTATDFAPYATHDSSGKWKGIDVEIAGLIFESCGVRFRIVDLPRRRITLMLDSNKLSGLLTTASYQIDSTLKDMWLSKPLYSSEVSVYTLKETSVPEHEESLLEQGRIRLGVLNEFSSNIQFNRRLPPSNILRVKRDRQLVDLLLMRRVDFVMTEDISFVYQARKKGVFERLKWVEEITSQKVRLALKKKVVSDNEWLPEMINRKIGALLASGQIDDIIVSHLSIPGAVNQAAAK